MTPEAPRTNGGVTWRWIAATAIGILILGTAGWMTAMERRVNSIEAEQKTEAQSRAEQGKDIAVIREKVNRVEQDQREIKEDMKDISRKLDELLRLKR